MLPNGICVWIELYGSAGWVDDGDGGQSGADGRVEGWSCEDELGVVGYVDCDDAMMIDDKQMN